MADKKTIVEAFLKWFSIDQHHLIEDYYQDTMTIEYLSNLTREKFIDYFFDFAHDGGKIQSQGYRTAGNFKESMIAHYDEFRGKILELFSKDFNVDAWLSWAESFKHLGPGLSTIILNRRDKYKYAVVNNKSYDGLQQLGFKLSSRNLVDKYNSILKAEKALLFEFPELDNLFRVDAMMHFIIGTDEGMALMKKENGRGEIISVKKEYFKLDGFRNYRSRFGEEYDPMDQSTIWYKDTRSKHEYLVGLLKERLSENISINYSEMPQARAGLGRPPILKKYVITGFSPDGQYPNGELFIKLAFHNLNTNPVLDVELDQNKNSPDRPFESTINELREYSRKSISVDENFPDNWETLVDEIHEHVAALISTFREMTKKQNTIDSETQVAFIQSIAPLNTIIYGPPGTGKTYGTIDKSLNILGETIGGMDRKVMKKKFSDYQKSNRVFFTTFHQNMAYEDFIEGIKPVEPLEDDEFLRYEIQDGLFMRACVEATFDFIRSNFEQDKAVEELLDFNGLFDKLIDRISKTGSEKIYTKTGSKLVATITSQGNISIKHEGRDKPYTVSRERLSKLYEKFPSPDEISNINDSFRKTIGGSNSTAYWSVLNEIVKLGKTAGIKDVIIPASADIAYEDKRKVVKNYWEKKDYTVVPIDQSSPYVFIIDEINRGNVAQIFGELITLIEDDKRMGRQETLFAELPYSKHSFAIPPNLYIIGTMNTADRSVEALDSALRRRFSFIEMVPQPEKLQITTEGINLPEILRNLNNRLLILKDHDHTIGHAWLMGVSNLEQLKNVFGNKILPLLKEYFYNDFEKLGLVLGDAFFMPHEQVNSDVFANFSGGNGLAGQYEQSWKYRLKSTEDLTIPDFQSLAGK